jgi:hypothetical protein
MLNIEIIELAKTSNYKLLDFIGKGNSGSAYHTECGKVIKLTRNRSEFDNSLKIKGQKNKNIIHIFDAFEYKKGSYAIVSELLDTEKYQSHIDTLFDYIENTLFYSINSSIAQIEPSEINLPKEYIDIFKEVVTGICRLEEQGIYCYDVSECNIGSRGDEIVLFDLESELD